MDQAQPGPRIQPATTARVLVGGCCIMRLDKTCNWNFFLGTVSDDLRIRNKSGAIGLNQPMGRHGGKHVMQPIA
jgi:hypothetical protein